LNISDGEEENPFVMPGPNEKCPKGTEITTVERCVEADHWAKDLNLKPRRAVYYGRWKSVPAQCSSQIGGDHTIHFSDNLQSDNKRFVSGEFEMICEKGLLSVC
jgi:hypothetical protein